VLSTSFVKSSDFRFHVCKNLYNRPTIKIWPNESGSMFALARDVDELRGIYTASLQLRTLLPTRGRPPPFMRPCRGSLPRPAVLLQGWASRGRGARRECAAWWLRSVELMNVCDPSSCAASQFTSLVGTVRPTLGSPKADL
jgi:hypothetical protein